MRGWRLKGVFCTMDAPRVTRITDFPHSRSPKFPIREPRRTTAEVTWSWFSALPDLPLGSLNCPADFGIVYHLVFSASERALPPIELDASGCQSVRGLGPARWVARSPEFWPTLGSAMGLSSPSYATFRGSGPNG